jgi:hypothetical protein
MASGLGEGSMTDDLYVIALRRWRRLTLKLCKRLSLV